MPDLDNGFEPQDEAEAFDETNREDELGLGSADLFDDPDVEEDVYDVTSAAGDADDDDDDGETADDYDDAELRALDLDNEEDADEDDDLDEAPEYDAREGLDRMIDRTAERAAPIEPGLVYTDDLDAITYPRDDDVEKYESTRQLSDEQLADLGYLDRPQTEETNAMTDNKNNTETASGADKADKTKDSRNWEDRSFSVDPETALVEGSGASADDVPEDNDPDEEDRLDEGLEETFPASDPVSAKHIT